jgi:hypothetical protein
MVAQGVAGAVVYALVRHGVTGWAMVACKAPPR